MTWIWGIEPGSSPSDRCIRFFSCLDPAWNVCSLFFPAHSPMSAHNIFDTTPNWCQSWGVKRGSGDFRASTARLCSFSSMTTMRGATGLGVTIPSTVSKGLRLETEGWRKRVSVSFLLFQLVSCSTLIVHFIGEDEEMKTVNRRS